MQFYEGEEEEVGRVPDAAIQISLCLQLDELYPYECCSYLIPLSLSLPFIQYSPRYLLLITHKRIEYGTQFLSNYKPNQNADVIL